MTTLSPLPSGFTSRPATMADVEACTQLIHEVDIHQIGTSNVTPDITKSDWETPNFTLDHNTRVVLDPENRIVGYMSLWDMENPPVNMWVWGCVHPDFEGRGIGTHLMTWANMEASKSIARCPEGTRVVYKCDTASAYEPSNQFFQKMGLQQIRYFFDMQIVFDGTPIPKPVLPANITIRTYNHETDLENTVQAVEDAFQDHWGYIEKPLEEAIKKFKHWFETDDKNEADLWFLAVDGDEIAGMSLCRSEAYDTAQQGFVGTLGVCRAWRRQGVALALLHHTFSVFQQRGKAGVSLGVDAGSLTGATKLYEKAGMHVKRQWNAYEKELRAGQDITRQDLDG